MGRKKHKDKAEGGEEGPFSMVSEIVAMSVQLQLDEFLKDEHQMELKFPSSLSRQERAFIHEKAKVLGIQSKSTGSGAYRYITIYKPRGSSLIQKDASFDMTSAMNESINILFSKYPITEEEKNDLSNECKKEVHLKKNVILSGSSNVPNTFINPDIIAFKRDLPVYGFKDKILDCMKMNQVMIVLGETGSGKTTQIPQFVMDQCQAEKKPCRIVCTQPRRISAISVAERVAYERNESVGHSIGYQIRLESKVSSKTVLTYCTSGVLLRNLMDGGVLNNVTHIIVDEVHERDKLMDFLLISLRDIAVKYRDLRIVLMSATIDPTLFSSYFNDCPVLSIPGRLFEVEHFFLEDILEKSGYFSKDMEKVRRHLGFSKPKPREYKEEQPQSSKVVQEEIQQCLDPDLQADVDEFLQDCYSNPSVDSFAQMLFIFDAENVPVDTKHSMSGLTCLMAAAYHGEGENIHKLLKKGANVAITDKHGKTAIDYARQRGYTDCADYLSYVTSGLITKQGDVSKEEDLSSECNELLEMYQQTVPEDAIDYNLMFYLIQHIHLNYPKGSILVFIAGYEDIISLKTLIENCDEMNQAKYQIFTLHSNMQTSDQKRVFSKMYDTRKIILSTNIAETSITIDDVVYVIDSGKAKEMYFESITGACCLQLIWISKAGIRQRAGRAGRSQPGKCFLLCSKRRFQGLLENSVAEILRSSIHELCLQSKRLAPPNTPIADFLSKAMEPPCSSGVRYSVALLKTIGALTPMENLTELGQLLLNLPLEPRLGKMLIYACIFKCLDPILTLISSLSFSEPFEIGSDPESRKKGARARRGFAANSMSDHMALLKAYQQWLEARKVNRQRAFCEKNVINGATMECIYALKSKFISELRSIGLVKSNTPGEMKDLNVNSDKWHVIKGVMFCGLYPNIARVDRQTMVLRSSKEVKINLHTQSTLLHGRGKENHLKALKELSSDWIMFGDVNRVNRVCYIRNNTAVTAITVALFGGPLRLQLNSLQKSPTTDDSDDSETDDDDLEDLNKEIGYLSVDDWIVFKSNYMECLGVLLLRIKFAAMIIRRMLNPLKVATSLDNQILDTVVDLLGKAEHRAGWALEMGVWENQETNSYYKSGMSRRSNGDNKYCPNSSYRPGSNPYYSYGPASGKNRTSNFNNKDRKSSTNALNNPPSSGNQCKFFFVRAASIRVIEESHRNQKWSFNSGAEQQILLSAKNGFQTILFFSIGGAVQKFTGWAEFVLAHDEGDPPTTYPLRWINTNHLTHNAGRHLMNSLDENRRVGGTRDGCEIEHKCAVELMALIESGGTSIYRQ